MRAFIAAGTQWRTAALAAGEASVLVFLGLDYAGARAGIEASGITITPDLWRGLQIMEMAALPVLNGNA